MAKSNLIYDDGTAKVFTGDTSIRLSRTTCERLMAMGVPFWKLSGESSYRQVCSPHLGETAIRGVKSTRRRARQSRGGSYTAIHPDGTSVSSAHLLPLVRELFSAEHGEDGVMRIYYRLRRGGTVDGITVVIHIHEDEL